jgi:trk system potassium uptake protein TrkA
LDNVILLFKKKRGWIEVYIIVVGGGEVGYNLTKVLLKEGHEVALIEKSRSRYEELSAEFGELVLYGDGSERDVLISAGANRADVVVAVTGEDSDNLVICQLAKLLFLAPKTIARINDPKNEDISRLLGIDATVSSVSAILSVVEQEIMTREIVSSLPLKHSEMRLVEIKIKRRSPAAGKLVQEINIPKRSVFVFVVRGKEVIIPRGDTRLLPDDTVIALTSMDSQDELISALLGKGE